MLLGEEFLVDVLGKSHVEQSVLLLDDERFLPGQFLALSAAVGLGIASLRRQHQAEPVADRCVFDLHLVEEGQHLDFDVGFSHPDARMILLRVPGAAVIDMVVDTAILSLLLDQLAGDRMAAMTAGHELPGIGQRGGVVGVAAQESLYPFPGRPVDDWLMFAGIPFPLVFQLADIGPVLQDVGDGTAGERRLRVAERPAFAVDPLDQPVERQVLVGVEMEDAFDVGCRFGIDLDDAPSILAGVAVAIGSLADEPALFDPPSQALANIDRLLFGVEARHVGQRPPHHPPGGRVFGRLRYRNERQVVFGFQPFEFNVIEQVARCPIDLVEQQPIEGEGVLLGVGDQFAERLAFITLAGRLGDLKELDDLAARLLSISLQSFLLDFEREALPFLFPAADAGQCGKLFHGMSPRKTENKKPATGSILTIFQVVRETQAFSSWR